MDQSCGLGTEIAALFRKAGLEADIPELRGHKIQPPEFDDPALPLQTLLP